MPYPLRKGNRNVGRIRVGEKITPAWKKDVVLLFRFRYNKDSIKPLSGNHRRAAILWNKLPT